MQQLALIKISNQVLLPNATLKFLGKQVNLFNPILLETTAISPTDTHSQAWQVSFFHGSPFAQHLRIEIHEVSNLNEQDLSAFFHPQQHAISRVFTALHPQIGKVDLHQLSSPPLALLEKASYAIRQSKSLKFEEFSVLSNSLRHIDSRGMIVFNYFHNEQSQDHNLRLMLMLMLAHAYRLAMQKISQSLAAVVQNQEMAELDRLYQDAAIFNARFYFSQPINLQLYPSAMAWQDMRESLSLDAQNQEISRQLAQVHQILSYRQQKEEQRLEKEQAERDKIYHRQMEKNQHKIELFAVFLSLLGLIEVAKTLYDWWRL